MSEPYWKSRVGQTSNAGDAEGDYPRAMIGEVINEQGFKHTISVREDLEGGMVRRHVLFDGVWYGALKVNELPEYLK